MAWRSVVHALIAGILLVASGCAGTGMRSPLAWRNTRDKISSDTSKDTKPSPFKQPEANDSSDAKTLADDKSSPTTDKTKDATKDTALASSHDGETLKLINEELKNATLEEREQWFKDLKGIDPQMVRQILRMRRMVVRMGQNEPGDASIADASAAAPSTLDGTASPGGSEIVLTGMSAGMPAEEPGFGHSVRGPEQPMRGSPGLGTTSPWGSLTPSTPAVAGQQPDREARPAAFQSTMPASNSASLQMTAQQSPSAPQPAVSEPPPYPGLKELASARAQRDGLQPPSGTDAASQAVLEDAFMPIGGAESSTKPFGAPQRASSVTQANGVMSASDSAGTLVPARYTGEAIPDMPPSLGASLLPATDGSSAGGSDLELVIARWESKVAELSPGNTKEQALKYIQRHVFLRMLYLMSGQQERALTAIPGVNAADQEFWQQVFWSVTNYFDAKAIPDPGDRATQTITQLGAAVQRLQENAKLDVPVATFCRNIRSYGDYDKLPRDEFRPGQPVLLYAEVRNFKSEPTSDYQYRTVLRSWVEIYRHRADGKADPVDGGEVPFPESEDLCRNQRHDYFNSYDFTIPQRISPGPHVLKLYVEDMLNQKVATYSLNFTVN